MPLGRRVSFSLGTLAFQPLPIGVLRCPFTRKTVFDRDLADSYCGKSERTRRLKSKELTKAALHPYGTIPGRSYPKDGFLRVTFVLRSSLADRLFRGTKHKHSHITFQTHVLTRLGVSWQRRSLSHGAPTVTIMMPAQLWSHVSGSLRTAYGPRRLNTLCFSISCAARADGILNCSSRVFRNRTKGRCTDPIGSNQIKLLYLPRQTIHATRARHLWDNRRPRVFLAFLFPFRHMSYPLAGDITSCHHRGYSNMREPNRKRFSLENVYSIV